MSKSMLMSMLFLILSCLCFLCKAKHIPDDNHGATDPSEEKLSVEDEKMLTALIKTVIEKLELLNMKIRGLR